MTTDAIEPSDDPQAVKFSVQGHSNIECIAYVLYGQYGINFRLSQSIFNQPPEVEILHLDGFCRVRINDGQTWFDTSDESAMKIKQLFESGKAPS